jgi:hypothetical protein
LPFLIGHAPTRLSVFLAFAVTRHKIECQAPGTFFCKPLEMASSSQLIGFPLNAIKQCLHFLEFDALRSQLMLDI